MRPLSTTFLVLISLFSVLHLVNAHAAPESVTLPTLTVMADRELREETEFMLPLQQQSSQKKALKMRTRVISTFYLAAIRHDWIACHRGCNSMCRRLRMVCALLTHVMVFI